MATILPCACNCRIISLFPAGDISASSVSIFKRRATISAVVLLSPRQHNQPDSLPVKL